MTRKIISYLFAILLIGNACLASEIDEDIITVMDKARCFCYAFEPMTIFINASTNDGDPSWGMYAPVYSDGTIGPVRYWNQKVSYDIFASANITLIDSVHIKGSDFYEYDDLDNNYLQDEYVVELYGSNNGDYLAIARCGEIVYCMQYINNDDSQEYYDKGTKTISVYTHYVRSTHTVPGYMYTRVAYFLDGTCVGFDYDEGTDIMLRKEHYTNSGMLIKYFDVCTYDEEFSDESTPWVTAE